MMRNLQLPLAHCVFVMLFFYAASAFRQGLFFYLFSISNQFLSKIDKISLLLIQ